jgi:uncharacterized alpha-E superfamily protein
MLSRVADAIHWMARYIERAENVSRFVDVTYNLNLDLPVSIQNQWQPLVSTTGDQAWFAEHYGESNRENVVHFLTFNTEYPNSIISCVRAARENARSIRETISSEMWEHLNRFYHVVTAAAADDRVHTSPQDFFHEVKLSSHLFRGIMDGTMSHGEGWNFARLGRYLERADKTSRILDVKYYVLLPTVQDVGTTIDDLQWSSVLRSVSGFEMFRKRHHSITPERVIEFLMLDRLFPRAIMYCLNAAKVSLHAITGSPSDTFWNLAEKRMGQLRSDLAYTQVADIMTEGLHEFVDAFQTKLNLVGEAIHQTFIALRPDREVWSNRWDQNP